MLAAFGFEALGVVVGDIYFIDPVPLAGQETPERGVKLQVRLVDRAQLVVFAYHTSLVSAREPG